MISSPTDQDTELTPGQPAGGKNYRWQFLNEPLRCIIKFHRILEIYINLVGTGVPDGPRFYGIKYKIKP